MDTKVNVAVAIGFILGIILLAVVITWLLFKYANRKDKFVHNDRPSQAESPHKILRALVITGQHVELMGGAMEYVIPFTLGDTIDRVYIKFYDTYRPMVPLMYNEEVGWVLLPEDNQENDPKYYPLHKVHIGIPSETFVEGYIAKRDDDEVFVVTNIIENELVS